LAPLYYHMHAAIGHTQVVQVLELRCDTRKPPSSDRPKEA
jgi:hypothetical protein